MSNCEQIKTGFRKMLDTIPLECHFKMHGSFRHSVYPGWKSDEQNNEDLHLLYVWGGEGTYHMKDGTDIKLERGTLVFISHGVLHHASINPQNPVKIAGLRFGLYDHGGQDCTKKADSFYYSFLFHDFLGINELTWKIHQLFHKKKDNISLTVCSMLLYQLLYELLQSLSVDPNKNEANTNLQKVRQSIEEAPFEKISMESLAKQANMSVRYLQKCFKKAYSFTPKEYHLNVQMNMAYNLLKQNSTVAHVAEMLGYCDAFAFSKQFKKQFGYAPTQARNEMKQS